MSGSGYSMVRVWSLSGLLLHTLRGHMGVVRCLHLDGSRLVSGGDRKAIIVWDIAVSARLSCLSSLGGACMRKECRGRLPTR